MRPLVVATTMEPFRYIAEPASTAALKGLGPCIERVDQKFAPMYPYVGHHPQLRLEPQRGCRTWIYFYDPAAAMKELYLKLSKAIEIPLVRSQDMERLHPG